MPVTTQSHLSYYLRRIHTTLSSVTFSPRCVTSLRAITAHAYCTGHATPSALYSPAPSLAGTRLLRRGRPVLRGASCTAPLLAGVVSSSADCRAALPPPFSSAASAEASRGLRLFFCRRGCCRCWTLVAPLPLRPSPPAERSTDRTATPLVPPPRPAAGVTAARAACATWPLCSGHAQHHHHLQRQQHRHRPSSRSCWLGWAAWAGTFLPAAVPPTAADTAP